MNQEIFDTDSFEDQLAFVLLDVLFKKDAINRKTYNAVKSIITEQEESHEYNITTTTNISN